MNIIYPHKKIEAIKPGDKFICLVSISCRSGKVISKGSIIEVIEMSGMTPHNEIMERGYNLLVKTEHEVSIWATLEQCLSRGIIEKNYTINHAKE